MSDMRDELLDAAERQIRSSGYDAFSFREIAKEVGIKSSSVHYYFPTKADLGVEVARRYTDRFFESLPDSPQDRTKALADAFSQAIRRDDKACLCGVLGSVHGSLPSPVGAEAKRFFELAIAYLLNKQRSTTTKRAEREWAFQVVALLEGGMILALALDDKNAFTALTRTLPSRP
ncbi:TetR/AcrR family transcriptional regulator [Terriglobus roseus]|uniref:Transcriptional regulator, TetR family n=1 Tax=Terriglobus roseus TaxID=392734 RepID=A0A1G7PR96_9BACT|nr:TetR/AcrR family transcriptional regulator [Terriglobus roseus]SDF88744.1 transcriptional regulator, TetR family [Terriglobus roseus]